MSPIKGKANFSRRQHGPVLVEMAGLGTREQLSLQGPVTSNSCKPVTTIRLYGGEGCSVFPALQGTSLVTAPNSWAGPGTWRGHGFRLQERRMPKPLRCGTLENGGGDRRQAVGAGPGRPRPRPHVAWIPEHGACGLRRRGWLGRGGTARKGPLFQKSTLAWSSVTRRQHTPEDTADSSTTQQRTREV